MLVKLIFIVSLFAILVLVFKKIPQISQLPTKSQLKRIESIPGKKIIDIENLEKRLSSFLEKLFKKLRIFALKLENFSTKFSKKFQERSKTLSGSESKKSYWEKFKK